MNWDNLLSLFRMENLVYWIVTMVVVILTTIKQFNRQEQKNKTNNDEILTNLQKMLNLLEMHSQDIKSLKKDVNVLEHRVSRLEDSQVNIYNRLGGKENDNT